MPRPLYQFLTRWRLAGTPEEVFRIIDDPPGLARWWPAVWLKVEVLELGDADGVGKLVRYVSKGWLPYRLHWTSRTVEKEFPRRMRLAANGDFEGEGVWTFAADGEFVNVEYLWRIEANKPLLKYLSIIFRPLFAANHRWAMARGEESLKLELQRVRAASEEERLKIPPPPGPTW